MVRPLDEQGRWQCKTEKEYHCMKNGEEQDFTADHSYSCRAAANRGIVLLFLQDAVYR